MLRLKGKRVKTIKVLRTQKRGVPVVNPSQGQHMWVYGSRWNFFYNLSL